MRAEKIQDKKKYIQTLIKRLAKKYPDTQAPLIHSNALEMLIATILSAQCTDVRVNIVTKNLFQKYKTLDDYLNADLEEFRNDIRSINFYKNKGKNILNTCAMIQNNFNGKVPDTLEDLITLEGVSRKTANVVLFHTFNKNIGFVVDTHVFRVSYRLGLTTHTKPEQVEQDLMKIFPPKEWGKISLRIIFHGRALCKARNPQCPDCFLGDICPFSCV